MKCKMCETEIPTETCVFAQYKRTIKGKQYVFCCKMCADEFEKRT